MFNRLKRSYWFFNNRVNILHAGCWSRMTPSQIRYRLNGTVTYPFLRFLLQVLVQVAVPRAETRVVIPLFWRDTTLPVDRPHEGLWRQQYLSTTSLSIIYLAADLGVKDEPLHRTGIGPLDAGPVWGQGSSCVYLTHEMWEGKIGRPNVDRKR